MSSLRPGTVDYSHFDNISCSDSEEEEEEKQLSEEEERNYESEEESDGSSEYDESDDEDLNSAPPSTRHHHPSARTRGPTSSASAAQRPAPDLGALQRAWGITSSSTDGDNKPQQIFKSEEPDVRRCANCTTPNPRFKCSRCRMVWFCNANCQRAYHPVHRHECIDASTHNMFWGVLLHENSEKRDKEVQLKALEFRRMAKRRRALKRAAAAAAVERARVTRETRGVGNKAKGKDPQDREEMCSICQCEFTISGDSGVGLVCPGSHFMCAECAGVFCNSVLGNLETSYPPRCFVCRAEFPMNHFERQLTTKQQVQVRTFAARRALKPGEILVKCPECDFFEVCSTDPVVWWCNGCGKGTCLVCQQDLPHNAVKYDLERSPHAVCRALRTAKAIVERAIDSGSKMSCPGCGLAGRKDDACTHMTCPKCTTIWCYVCGLDVKSCDKALPREGRPIDDIFLHNQDWETNDKRCPMYLTQILEVDMSWLGENWEERATDDDFEDDEKCLDHFHRFQTIRNLQRARETVGARDFEAVFENFGSIKNSGYTLEEIVSTCTDNLIDREEFLRYRVKPDDDSEDDDQEDEDDGAGSHQDGVAAADNEDSEEGEWEAVPEEMTRAALAEEEHMRQAIERSQASLQEEEQLREVLEASAETSRNAERG